MPESPAIADETGAFDPLETPHCRVRAIDRLVVANPNPRGLDPTRSHARRTTPPRNGSDRGGAELQLNIGVVLSPNLCRSIYYGSVDRREDYLKVIYKMASEGETVTAGRVAEWLGLSSPSVSAMAKRLESELLLERSPAGWRLTSEGEQTALRVVRRHRLMETFLAEVLGMAWDEVHDEAEALEHAVSSRLEERIDAALGHPRFDPHGDPIPPLEGPHHESVGVPLGSAAEGSVFRVERVSDRDSAVLRYLAGLGIVPGAVLELEKQEPFGGPRWVRANGQMHALGSPICDAVRGTILSNGATSAARESA